MDKIIAWGLVIMAAYTLYAVVTPNHLFVGQGFQLQFLIRGLYALTLTIFFQSQLLAEYLYKDEVIHRASFDEQVEKLGSELYEKTGIALKLVMLKKLPDNTYITKYEEELLKSFKEPTILLTFSEDDMEIDIQVNDALLAMLPRSLQEQSSEPQ